MSDDSGLNVRYRYDMMDMTDTKRISPSPSRSSLRSESRGIRPRVIQVNRDASTMVDTEHDEFANNATRNMRSRTFSDGFIRDASLELLLGLDCQACLELATKQRSNEHISNCDFNLVCNCNLQRNNFINYPNDPFQNRGHTLNIFDLQRMRNGSIRNQYLSSSHKSLDRKFSKNKSYVVSNYLPKHLISYDQTNSFLRKIKRKLSSLKRIGGETLSKKHQNTVQLAEFASGSVSSLKKLSMLSLVDKSNRTGNDRNGAFASSDLRLVDEMKNRYPTQPIADNFNHQPIDRYTDFSTINSFPVKYKPQRVNKVRSLSNSDDVNKYNVGKVKFSTLDNRGKMRNIRRQMSYNDFPSCRNDPFAWDQDHVTRDPRAGYDEVLDGMRHCSQERCEAITAAAAPPICTCDTIHYDDTPTLFHLPNNNKTLGPTPDIVTDRSPHVNSCRSCKESPHWIRTTNTSTTSRSSTTTGNSNYFSTWPRRWCCVAMLVLVAGTACVAGPLALRAPPGSPLHERIRIADRLLHDTPLIDGHNDLPWNIRKFLHNKIKNFRFDEDLRTISPWATSSWSHTDLPRLKQGRIAAQFWAAYVPCDAQHRDAVQLTFEQIDLIQRLTDKYQPQLTLCTSAEDILNAHKNHRMCSLVGVEGGHAIGGSLGVLRTLYQVGVRYLTLTSTCDTPWAECASDVEAASRPNGLTPFGKIVIKEMNRIGMLVDLSHVSERTMRDALSVSQAPVLFSHSSARALCNVTRNVPDGVLRILAANKGLVMVNFYTSFLTCRDSATVKDAIAHINHIRDVAGVDSVGLGAGYDGINYTPQGLEDVSSYPMLFAELMDDGWSIDDLKKLAGLNLLRVLERAESVSKELVASDATPYEESAPRSQDVHNCSSQDT